MDNLKDKKISAASIDAFNKGAALAVQVFANTMLWQVIQFCQMNDIDVQSDELNTRLAELKEFMNASTFLDADIFKSQGAEIVE